MPNADSRSDAIYAQLKSDLAQGLLSVHVRLDFAELAARYDVSTTPVREAAMRLFGEGLLDLHPKGGLRPVSMREHDLVASLVLHERLCLLALRWPGAASIAIATSEPIDLAERAHRLFIALVTATGNREFARVMTGIEDRIERYRRYDTALLPDVASEMAILEAAIRSPNRLSQLMRRYHRRRQALAGRSILAASDAVDDDYSS